MNEWMKRGYTNSPNELMNFKSNPT